MRMGERNVSKQVCELTQAHAHTHILQAHHVPMEYGRPSFANE